MIRRPSTPLVKYWGDQNDRYGGRLVWPGHPSGIPVRGAHVPKTMTGPEMVAQMAIVGQKFVGVFDLSNQEQKDYYVWVMDRIRNGLFTEDYVERHWYHEEQKMVVYLEWTQLYATLPPGKTVAEGEHNDSFTIRGAAARR